MSDAPQFTAGLIRAANKISGLSNVERGRLIERAIATIADMRGRLGIPSSGTDADALSALGKQAEVIGALSDDAVRAMLLDAAAMIRDLHIVAEEEVKLAFTFVPSGNQ